MKHNLASIVYVAGWVIATGCGHVTSPSAPPSAIVEKVEKAGAGDLSSVSRESLRAWLLKHQELAREVDEMCKPVRETASASWGDTAEGRVCEVAALFRPPPVVKGTGKGFRAGTN